MQREPWIEKMKSQPAISHESNDIAETGRILWPWTAEEYHHQECHHVGTDLYESGPAHIKKYIFPHLGIHACRQVAAGLIQMDYLYIYIYICSGLPTRTHSFGIHAVSCLHYYRPLHKVVPSRAPNATVWRKKTKGAVPHTWAVLFMKRLYFTWPIAPNVFQAKKRAPPQSCTPSYPCS